MLADLHDRSSQSRQRRKVDDEGDEENQGEIVSGVEGSSRTIFVLSADTKSKYFIEWRSFVLRQIRKISPT